MTNENKIASMDAVGEMYDMGNLLLREGGFPHLPDPVFVPEKKADAWSDGKPSKAGVYETRVFNDDRSLAFQLWNGRFWDCPAESKEEAIAELGASSFQDVQWREVQP
jgi:hypothetical protein